MTQDQKTAVVALSVAIEKLINYKHIKEMAAAKSTSSGKMAIVASELKILESIKNALETDARPNDKDPAFAFDQYKIKDNPIEGVRRLLEGAESAIRSPSLESEESGLVATYNKTVEAYKEAYKKDPNSVQFNNDNNTPPRSGSLSPDAQQEWNRAQWMIAQLQQYIAEKKREHQQDNSGKQFLYAARAIFGSASPAAKIAEAEATILRLEKLKDEIKTDGKPHIGSFSIIVKNLTELKSDKLNVWVEHIEKSTDPKALYYEHTAKNPLAQMQAVLHRIVQLNTNATEQLQPILDNLKAALTAETPDKQMVLGIVKAISHLDKSIVKDVPGINEMAAKLDQSIESLAEIYEFDPKSLLPQSSKGSRPT